MKTHKNQSVTSIFIKLFLLISMLIINNAFAVECTSLQLISARNSGVTVRNNPCKAESKIALGTILKVSTGSRLWLKSVSSENGAIFQVICQNRTGQTVNVAVDSASLPWIKPQGLKNCGQWVSNKLSCDNKEGQKNRFFCAVAVSKPMIERSTPKPTTSTSFRMRSLFTPKGRAVKEIIKAIKPDVELCKNLYDVRSKIKVMWTVSKLGKVKTVNLNIYNTELKGCIESVLASERHKKSKKDIIFQQDF